MKKDKRKLSDIQKSRAQHLESKDAKEGLKKDVGLTDKKGDNLPLGPNEDLHRTGNIHGKKGPRR